jgi:hypothetical protein
MRVGLFKEPFVVSDHLQALFDTKAREEWVFRCVDDPID